MTIKSLIGIFLFSTLIKAQEIKNYDGKISIDNLKIINANFLGDHPHQRGIFIFADFSAEQDDYPVSRTVRCMAVGGVDKIGHPSKRGSRDRDEVYIFWDTVRVKRADPAADDVSVLADAATQPPAHETAVVFGVIPALLGQLRIFLHRFRGANRIFQPLAQRVEGDGFIRPDLGKAAAAIGDLQFSHDTCTS